MPAVGDARERHSVKFYPVAMIFLLFDIEIAFLYPWAAAKRPRLVRICPDSDVLPDPSRRLYLRLAQGAARLGASAVRLHPRTVRAEGRVAMAPIRTITASTPSCRC